VEISINALILKNGVIPLSKLSKNDYIWLDFFQKNSISIFKGSKRKNVHDIILGLAINGPSTNSTLAKYTLSKEYPSKNLEDYKNNLPLRTNEYHRLLNGTKGRINLSKTKFIKQIETKLTEKKIKTGFYNLSPSGYFIALGLNYSDNELKLIIKNASAISLYFSYVNRIMEQTSLEFVKKIFIDPFKSVLSMIIDFEKDLIFYYPNVSELTYRAVDAEIVKILSKFSEAEAKSELVDTSEFIPIEFLMDETIYASKTKDDFHDFLIEHFYKNNRDIDFYREHSTDMEDLRLVTLVMKAVHFTYYESQGYKVPSKSRIKITRSKEWKKHKRFLNKNKQKIFSDKLK
jgi:hypothetical protein